MRTTRGSGTGRQRLEPDDEQSSRPVLRGLGLGNEARLPDTSPCASSTRRRPPKDDRPTRRASEEGARLADAVERIRRRLWHGQVRRALDLIRETLARLGAMAEAAPVAAAKVAALLRGLETYVSGQADLIIDYAEGRRRGEPISTATTESTVQWLLHRRMGANQQMR